MSFVGQPKQQGHPIVTLEEAIKKVEMIFKKRRREVTHRTELGKDIGFKSWHGGSASLISTFTKYGLLEPFGNRGLYRVTDDAVAIITHKRGESERVRAIRNTAFKPQVFRELHRRYRGIVPSEESIQKYLREVGIAETGASLVFRLYRDTIEYVNAETGGSPMEPVEEIQEGSMQTPPSKQTTASSEKQDVKEYELTFKPAPNVIRARVEIAYTGTLTQEILQKAIEHIQLDMSGFPGDVLKSKEKATNHRESSDVTLAPETDHA